jgi:hypothetical protein
MMLWKQVEAIEKEKHMPHLLSFELRAMERGIDEGRKEGLKEGRTSALLEAIHDSASAKFGSAIAAEIMAKIGPSTETDALKKVQIAVATAVTGEQLRQLLPQGVA